jgi:predicted nucleic acid-binding protein
MTVSDALNGVTKLGIDANVFLSIIGEELLLISFCLPFMRAIERGEIKGIASIVALTECLTKPYKDNDVTQEYTTLSLLEATNNLSLVLVSNAIAKRAARLRADYNLRTPDALHVATAIESGCEAFLTNDLKLARITEIRVIILSSITI